MGILPLHLHLLHCRCGVRGNVPSCSFPSLLNRRSLSYSTSSQKFAALHFLSLRNLHIESRMPPPVAVITGASSGIGLALTKHLLEREWNVVMADVNPPKEDLENMLFIKTDISSWDQQASMFRQAFEWNSRLDFCALNAGIDDRDDIFSSISGDPTIPPTQPNMKTVSPYHTRHAGPSHSPTTHPARSQPDRHLVRSSGPVRSTPAPRLHTDSTGGSQVTASSSPHITCPWTAPQPANPSKAAKSSSHRPPQACIRSLLFPNTPPASMLSLALYAPWGRWRAPMISPSMQVRQLPLLEWRLPQTLTQRTVCPALVMTNLPPPGLMDHFTQEQLTPMSTILKVFSELADLDGVGDPGWVERGKNGEVVEGNIQELIYHPAPSRPTSSSHMNVEGMKAWAQTYIERNKKFAAQDWMNGA